MRFTDKQTNEACAKARIFSGCCRVWIAFPTLRDILPKQELCAPCTVAGRRLLNLDVRSPTQHVI